MLLMRGRGSTILLGCKIDHEGTCPRSKLNFTLRLSLCQGKAHGKKIAAGGFFYAQNVVK